MAGCINQVGVLLQKKIINQHLDDPKFLKALTKNWVWIVGLFLQVIVGGALFYLLAQYLLGPALVPGLMSAGLIVLAIGSIKILGESLKKEELIGILLMMLGIILLSMSGLSIDVSSFDILDSGFLVRLGIFTIILSSATVFLKILATRNVKIKGILLGLVSGLTYSLTTVWIGPFTTSITHFIEGSSTLGEILLFIPTSLVVGFGAYFGITLAQKSFKEGQVNILSPIIGVPPQITPILAYFLIFDLVPAGINSIIFLVLGFIIILVSTVLLSQRQVLLDEIKK